MNKEKGKMEAKLSNLTAKMTQMSATLEEEQQLNRSLTQNQVRVLLMGGYIIMICSYVFLIFKLKNYEF